MNKKQFNYSKSIDVSVIDDDGDLVGNYRLLEGENTFVWEPNPDRSFYYADMVELTKALAKLNKEI